MLEPALTFWGTLQSPAARGPTRVVCRGHPRLSLSPTATLAVHPFCSSALKPRFTHGRRQRPAQGAAPWRLQLSGSGHLLLHSPIQWKPPCLLAQIKTTIPSNQCVQISAYHGPRAAAMGQNSQVFHRHTDSCRVPSLPGLDFLREASISLVPYNVPSDEPIQGCSLSLESFCPPLN